jgi:hypothetical protein
MVASRRTKGKEENSKGRWTLIQIIIIINPAMMLNVNKTSKAIEGKGTTSIDIIARITAGIARPFGSVKFKECRKFDTSTEFIFFPIISINYDYFTSYALPRFFS